MCGAIVGVARRAYTRPCRFYQGGPIGRIRYFFVAPTNEYLLDENVFWPYDSVGQSVRNTSGTGEITSALPARDSGRDFRPDLDGSDPQGTPEDFAGLTPWPGSPPAPASCPGNAGIRLFLWARSAWRVCTGEPVVSGMVLSADSVQAPLVGARGSLRVRLALAGSANPSVVAVANLRVKTLVVGIATAVSLAAGRTRLKPVVGSLTRAVNRKSGGLLAKVALDSSVRIAALTTGTTTVKVAVKGSARLVPTVTGEATAKVGVKRA